MTLLSLFWQILVSYCKFPMPRPLKWNLLGAHTIILSKNIHKVTKTNYVWFKFLWIRRYIDCAAKSDSDFKCCFNSVVNAQYNSIVLPLCDITEPRLYIVFCSAVENRIQQIQSFLKNTCQSNKELIFLICCIFNTCRNKCFVVFSLISNFTYATEDTYVQVSLMKAKKWQYRY